MKKPSGKAPRQNGRFVRLSYDLVTSKTWLGLSLAARALYVGIAARYNGRNNGDIPFSRREASAYLKVGPTTAVAAFKELEQVGLIKATSKGWISPKFQKATRWQINEYSDNLQNSEAQPTSGYRSHTGPVGGPH